MAFPTIFLTTALFNQLVDAHIAAFKNLNIVMLRGARIRGGPDSS